MMKKSQALEKPAGVNCHLAHRCFSCVSMTAPANANVTNIYSTASRNLRVISSYPRLHNPPLVQLSAIRQESTESSSVMQSAAAVAGGPTCCMPPPCNQPPRCLQNMTGYYHYPYGYWFCGPYNVTIAPTPCEGPVRPGGSCGPISGPCPNFHGVCPCKTCPPGPTCVASGPCLPCGLCGLCHCPYSGSNMGYYSQYTSNGRYTNAAYWNTPYQQSHSVHAYPERNNRINAVYSGTAIPGTQPKSVCEHRCESNGPPSRGISIDPEFVKSYPFNKPTFKRSEPTNKQWRCLSTA